jgi:NADH-quinone oxidoreductase subunit A
VQFDLRFYVVALLFIIFDVEVAFFFPWATVFGKATQLTDPHLVKVVQVAGSGDGVSSGEARVELSSAAAGKLAELGLPRPGLPDPTPDERRDPSAWAAENVRQIESTAHRLALAAMADIGVFFAVLMVGFAYVWSQGDLNWVRAFGRRTAADVSRLAEPAAAGGNLAAGDSGS